MMSRATVSDHLETTLSDAAVWLTAEDAALVGALRLTAEELERHRSPGLVTEYRRLLQDLHARKAQRISEMPPEDRLRMLLD